MAIDPPNTEDHIPTERDSLLRHPTSNTSTSIIEENQDDQDHEAEHSVPKDIARRLYLSHFLSTWNSRVFEFGAVLYLATIYPGTLLPMSVYALTRGVSAIVFAPIVGQYIDIGDRLRVVRFSIGTLQIQDVLAYLFSDNLTYFNFELVAQRLAVASSCVILYILAIRVPCTRGENIGMLVLLAFLACIEKLCSIMNLVSVEKDWVRQLSNSTLR